MEVKKEKSKRFIVGIDAALTATGWSVWDMDDPDASGYVDSGKIVVPPSQKAAPLLVEWFGKTMGRKFTHDREMIRRGDEIAAAIMAKVRRHETPGCSWLYVIELDNNRRMRPKQANQAVCIGMIAEYLTVMGRRNHDTREIITITSSTWKGGKAKDVTCAEATALLKKRLGRVLDPKKDHDEADAIMIAQYVAAVKSGTPAGM